MNKAWDKHNQVYLGIQVADTYNMFTKFPIKSIADIKGKKLYAPRCARRLVRGTGAVAVNGGLPVYYNGENGCCRRRHHDHDRYVPLLHEVGKYVTVVDMGGPISGAITMNKDTWNSLPAYMQDIFKKLYGNIPSIAAIIEKKAGLFLKLMAKQVLIYASGCRTSQMGEVMPNIAKEWGCERKRKGFRQGSYENLRMLPVLRARSPRNWDEGSNRFF